MRVRASALNPFPSSLQSASNIYASIDAGICLPNSHDGRLLFIKNRRGSYLGKIVYGLPKDDYPLMHLVHPSNCNQYYWTMTTFALEMCYRCFEYVVPP